MVPRSALRSVAGEEEAEEEGWVPLCSSLADGSGRPIGSLRADWLVHADHVANQGQRRRVIGLLEPRLYHGSPIPATIRRPRPGSGMKESECRIFRTLISEGIVCVKPHGNNRKSPARRGNDPSAFCPARTSLIVRAVARPPLKSATVQRGSIPIPARASPCAIQAAAQCTSLLSASSRGITGGVFFVDTILAPR